jgi:hypothetical protein
MLAYQMLQKEAGSTDGKVYSNAHGVMKLGAGMLGAALEGWEEKKLAKERQELAKAVLDMSGPIASRVVELRRCAEHGAANA